LDGLDFGSNIKATGVFDNSGKATTTWWEDGKQRATLDVSVKDYNTLQLSNGDIFTREKIFSAPKILDLSGVWTEKSGKHWRITMFGSFYTLDGLDFGRNRKATGVFDKPGKASTTWWEDGKKGATLDVSIKDSDTLKLSNGDIFTREKILSTSKLPDLSGIWTEKSGKHWRIIMVGSFYSLDGLDFGTDRKATGLFDNSGKASTTWWEDGKEGTTLDVSIKDTNTVKISNGDVFKREKILSSPKLPDLSGVWTEKSGKHWRIMMIGSFYTLDGLDFVRNRKATGIFDKLGKAKTTLWEDGREGATLDVSIKDYNTLELSNGDIFKREWKLPDLCGVWSEKSGKHWRIMMVGRFYTLDGLDFGDDNRKATGMFDVTGKASITWWENGKVGGTFDVIIEDGNILKLSNGDLFKRTSKY